MGRCAFVMAVSTLCLAPFETAFAASLHGQWVWDEHQLPTAALPQPPSGRSFQRLEFLSKKQVVGFQYFNNAFAKGGEALESEAYGYELRGAEIIFHSESGFSAGWPNHNLDVNRTSEACNFHLQPDGQKFTLSGCDLAGDWIKQTSPVK